MNKSKRKFIPLTEYPSYGFSTTVGGRLYFFSINWNEQYRFFSLDIADELGEALVQGIRLVGKINLLEEFKFADKRLPSAKIYIKSMVENQKAMSYENAGYFALYFEEVS